MKWPIRKILFVCSGNTCRSPMAEALFRHRLAKAHPEAASRVWVRSAGTSAPDGMAITPLAVTALEELGVKDGDRHLSSTIRREDVDVGPRPLRPFPIPESLPV